MVILYGGSESVTAANGSDESWPIRGDGAADAGRPSKPVPCMGLKRFESCSPICE